MISKSLTSYCSLLFRHNTCFVSLKYLALLVVLSAVCNQGVAQRNTIDQIEISLLTCSPGTDIYSIFGHSAIRIEDQSRDIDLTYNYGTFDFMDPNFYPKFLKGKLLYWLNIEPTQSFSKIYQASNRQVIEQKLNLDSLQKTNLILALNTNFDRQNKYYLYDFLFNNCSTKIDSIVNKSVSNLTYPAAEKISFRSMLHQYNRHLPWISFGMDIILGSSVDKKATVNQQTFLPDYLSQIWSETKMADGQSLVSDAKVYIRKSEQRSTSKNYFTPSLIMVLLLLLEFIILRYNLSLKWVYLYDIFWFAILFLSGSFLLFMWMGTNHKACCNNFNLIAFSPLFILLILSQFIKPMDKWKPWIGVIIILSFISLPFISASYQFIHPAILLMCVISGFKIVRRTKLSSFRKWV